MDHISRNVVQIRGKIFTFYTAIKIHISQKLRLFLAKQAEALAEAFC